MNDDKRIPRRGLSIAGGYRVRGSENSSIFKHMVLLMRTSQSCSSVLRASSKARSQSRNHRFAWLNGLLGVLLLHSTALALPFNLITNTAVAPPPPGTGIHGIARVGNEWFVANFNSGWNEYDLGFSQTGTTATVPITGATRGLVLNSLTGNLLSETLAPTRYTRWTPQVSFRTASPREEYR